MQTFEPSLNQTINPYVQPESSQGYFGFKGKMFPLVGAVVSFVTIIWTYEVAVNKNPPDVKPFPQTDITHTAIKFPQYVIFRIGLLVAPVIFAISFQILKNYLQAQSFQILGQQQKSLQSFGKISFASALALCVSTATISDGGDLDWTSHTIGATSFFILAMYMCITASKVYRKLYVVKPFCSFWSYQIKKYTNFFVIGFIVLTILDAIKLIDIGSFVEWAATFFLLFYFLSLYFDFKNFDIMLIRKR